MNKLFSKNNDRSDRDLDLIASTFAFFDANRYFPKKTTSTNDRTQPKKGETPDTKPPMTENPDVPYLTQENIPGTNGVRIIVRKPTIKEQGEQPSSLTREIELPKLTTNIPNQTDISSIKEISDEQNVAQIFFDSLGTNRGLLRKVEKLFAAKSSHDSDWASWHNFLNYYVRPAYMMLRNFDKVEEILFKANNREQGKDGDVHKIRLSEYLLIADVVMKYRRFDNKDCFSPDLKDKLDKCEKIYNQFTIKANSTEPNLTLLYDDTKLHAAMKINALTFFHKVKQYFSGDRKTKNRNNKLRK